MKSNLSSADRDQVGFYLIQNEHTGETYIGSGDLKTREYAHRSHLQKSDHDNWKLQRSYNRRPEAFSFIGVPIEEPGLSREENRELARQLEQNLIDEFKPNPLCLNISSDATTCLLPKQVSQLEIIRA